MKIQIFFFSLIGYFSKYLWPRETPRDKWPTATSLTFNDTEKLTTQLTDENISN